MHLVIVFGPPAVGKMTVGREVAQLTPYRLFHNHATIEPLLGIFEFGTEPFDRLKSEFRRRILEEAIAADLPGLVFTVVWALDSDSDREFLEELLVPIAAAGCRVDFVELWSSQGTRLAREGTPLRLEAKASKRDVEWARGNLLDWDARHRMNTGPDQPFPLADRYPHVRIDNDDLEPAEAAERIVDLLDLPRSSA